MNAALITGVFLLGTGAGALCVWLQQRGIRQEMVDQLNEALFGARRRDPRIEGESKLFIPPKFPLTGVRDVTLN